jgi:1,4-alpha-glucan branching enzyme
MRRCIGTPGGVGAMCWSRSAFPAGRRRRDVLRSAGIPRVSEQVWSGSIGYPGNGTYLEFHKKHGERGLRYWKVTTTKRGWGTKIRIIPTMFPPSCTSMPSISATWCARCCASIAIAPGARAFASRRSMRSLFGHWWFEGPRFLRDVILTLANDPEREADDGGGGAVSLSAE